MTSARKKAEKDIQEYLSAIQENIKHFVNRDADVWTIQASDNIVTIIEKYYTPKIKIKKWKGLSSK